MKMVTDTGIAFAREMVPELRAPIALAVNAVLPLLFLALFGPLLTSTPGIGEGSPWQWFLPGILVLLALSGTAGAGANLLMEINSGSFERMLVTPMNRTALLAGRTLKEVLTLAAQGVLLILVLLPTSFELFPLGALAGLVLLATFGVGLGALSFTLAVLARKQEQVFYIVQQACFLPLMLLSGVLLPMSLAPSWLYTVSRFNPVTHIVEAERALFAGRFAEPAVLYGGVCALAIAGLGLFFGARVMRNVRV